MEALIKKWRDHGESVHEHYNLLLSDPSKIGNTEAEEFFKNYKPLPGIEKYHIYHDCSKPYIQQIDEQGKVHYPNHSYHSSKMYECFFGKSAISHLILHDMDFHTKRGDDLKETWNLPYSYHLYATAWAELFANAQLFGGIESDSFKIKRKRLIQALKYKS